LSTVVSDREQDRWTIDAARQCGNMMLSIDGDNDFSFDAVAHSAGSPLPAGANVAAVGPAQAPEVVAERIDAT
jgi:hypothetical protein